MIHVKNTIFYIILLILLSGVITTMSTVFVRSDDGLLLVEESFEGIIIAIAGISLLLIIINNSLPSDIIGIWLATVVTAVIITFFNTMTIKDTSRTLLEESETPDKSITPYYELEAKYKKKSNKQVIDKIAILFFIITGLTVIFINYGNISREDWVSAIPVSMYIIIGVVLVLTFIYYNISSQMISPTQGDILYRMLYSYESNITEEKSLSWPSWKKIISIIPTKLPKFGTYKII